MASMKLQGKQRRNKYRSYKGEVGKITANTLNREFDAQKPFEKLVTDVTEFHVCNEKIYLSPVMDLFNREIVAHAISRSPSFVQTRAMLEQLFARLPKDATPIMHSDQGWQYQHRCYQHLLQQHGIIQSMSRKGNCLDNAVMENFFGLMKTELLYPNRWDDVETFKRALRQYIRYYNNNRIKLKLKMSPVKYRTHFQDQVK